MANNESGADHLQHMSTGGMEISGGGARIDGGLDRLRRRGGDGLGRDHTIFSTGQGLQDPPGNSVPPSTFRLSWTGALPEGWRASRGGATELARATYSRAG